MDFEGFPLIVGWELTLACNMRCKHCGSAAGSPRRNELSLTEALNICEQFPDLLVHEVNFTGGEPLFRPDWFQIATRLRELNIKTKIITNGLLLDAAHISQMKDAGFARVGVSIDGLEPTHDRIRNFPGLFNQILAGIERLSRAGIATTVITTANSLNISQLSDLSSILQSIGVDLWQIQPIFQLGRAQQCQELYLSDPEYLQLGQFVRGFGVLQPRDGLTLMPGDSYGYYSDMDERQPPWGGCSAGLDLCGITSDGRVKGCLSMPDELAVGDLRQQDLWDIWFDPNSFTYNRNFELSDLGENCSACPHREECRGGCSSMSYGCTGRMHNDPFCFTSILERQHSELVH